MVVGIVIKEVVKQGARILGQYYRIEGKAFNRLYTGFPQSKTIGRGIRHGLTLGSVSGSLINPEDDGINDIDGIQTPRKQPQTRSQYKTYNRFQRANRRSRKNYCRPGTNRRRSSYY